jgi:hypothetical protein
MARAPRYNRTSGMERKQGELDRIRGRRCLPPGTGKNRVLLSDVTCRERQLVFRTVDYRAVASRDVILERSMRGVDDHDVAGCDDLRGELAG